MEPELFRKEIWEELKQVSSNLYYIDELRSKKAKIEPLYKGTLALLAIVTVCLSFTEMDCLKKLSVIATGLMTIFPILYPFLPVSHDFVKIDDQRNKVKRWLIELEVYWQKDKTEENLNDYMRIKKAYAPDEAVISAIFGKINKKMQQEAIRKSELYLNRFDLTS